MTRPHDQAPADILRTAGFDLPADMVIGHILEPEKQRAAFYGTARQMLSCLTGAASLKSATSTSSRLIGQYSYINVSRSYSKAGPSSSRQESKDEILSVADLTARIVG